MKSDERDVALLEPSTRAASQPRLNPFAFPADTDFRFVLLIATIIGASLFIYNMLYFSTHDNKAAIATYLDCLGKASAAFPTDPFAQNEFFNQCRAPIEIAKALWILGASLILIVGAVLFYLAIPVWKIRRGGFKLLTADDAPEVVSTLQDLSREAGLRRPPIFLWQPLNQASSGLAFGHFGGYYVGLTGGLVTRYYIDQPAFRAIVLHELGHLRNGDVDKTYFTVAIWWAFVVGAIVPFVAVAVVERSVGSSLGLGWRVLGLAALVYLTRNAVLRAREVYADIRASSWDGPVGALIRVLHSLPKTSANPVRRLLGVHPQPPERELLIGEPHRLFAIGFWEAFGTGLAVAIAFPTIVSILGLLTTGLTASIFYVSVNQLIYVVVGLLLAPLVVGVVGLGVWRANFAATARGEASPDVRRTALGLGAGAAAGLWLALPAAISTQERPGLGDIAGSLVIDVLWSCLLLVSVFFFLRWMLAAAAAWVGLAATRSSPRPNYRAALLIGSALLAGWFALLFLAHDLFHGAIGSGLQASTIVMLLTVLFGGLFIVIGHPLTLAALLLIWAYPAVAGVGRRKDPGPVSNWVFLDSRPENPKWPASGAFPFKRGVILSVMAALVFLVVVVGIRIWVRITISDAARAQDQFRIRLFLVQVAVAILLELVVAAVAARRSDWLPAIFGVYVAFTSGLLMTIAMLVLNLLFGGTIAADFAWSTASIIVSGGGLLALPVAAVAAIHARRPPLLGGPAPAAAPA